MMTARQPRWWRQPFTQPAAGIARRIVVVTAVDGSLLEPGTESLPDQRAALEFLAARGIPLVINSSRTRAEIERLQRTLQMLAPFITENGSALFLPRGSVPFVPERARPAVGGDVIEFGKRYHEVVDALRVTCRGLDMEVVGFAELSIEEVAQELGVTMVEAQLAKLREYTELFRIIDEKDAMRSRLFKALHRRGLHCWQTGTHHLVSATPDRAEGLRTLRAIWKRVWGDPLLIGLGDSEDDVTWLRHVDTAIIVQNDRTGVPARLLSKLPTAHVTRWPGRHGWSEAVFEFVGRLLTADGQTHPTREVSGRSDMRSDARPPSPGEVANS